MFLSRTIFVILNLAALSSFCHSAETPLRLSYSFRVDVASANAPKIHVTLQFKGNGRGLTVLRLPSSWAGQNRLEDSIRNLKTDSNTQVLGRAGESLSLKYSPHHHIMVTYDLVAGSTGALQHPREFRVILTEASAIFNGNNALVFPDISESAKVRIGFEWKNLPQGWSATSSFGRKNRVSKFSGSWRLAHNALFAAGDFRIKSLDVDGESLTLAIRGKWLFSDPEASDEIARLIKAERRFWRERHRDKFLAVVSQFDQESGSSDGTAFTDSVLFFLSRKSIFDANLRSQLAHEVFHTWNPYKLRIERTDSTQWFTEGFTRFYQDRLLHDAGLISYPEYIERLNFTVARYWTSSDRNSSQKQWLLRRQNGNADSSLPYDRGAVIALWLDQALRTRSHNTYSLDDAMRDLQLRRGPGLTSDPLVSALSETLSVDQRNRLHAIVEGGDTVPLPTAIDNGCATLESENYVPRYEIVVSSNCK